MKSKPEGPMNLTKEANDRTELSSSPAALVDPILRSRSERLEPELALSKKQARKHLSALHEHGDGKAHFTFFIADDRKDVPRDASKVRPGQVYFGDAKLQPRSFRATLDEAWPIIVDANRRGCGVFVCTQIMDESGNRETSNCLGIRTAMNDLDHGETRKPYPKNARPQYSVQSSVHGRHDYFPVQNASFELYRETQDCLATHYDGDKAVKDRTRVMRLAGTYHRKTDAPFLCRVTIHSDEIFVYDGSELLAALGGRAEKPAATNAAAVAQTYDFQ